MNLKLYMAQRLSALIMAPLVFGHIAVMIYAIQGGLSTAEILGRTQGSIFWFLFYGIFVVAVSIHASIGLGVVLREWVGLSGKLADILSLAIGVSLLIMGGRAVLSVTFL